MSIGDGKMQEQRKYKRSNLEVKVQMRRCDSKEHEVMLAEVFDLSREGLGFYSMQDIQIGEFYNGEIVIWTKEVINVVFKVIRKSEVLDNNMIAYGAEFVGLTDAEKFRIDVYQCVEENVVKA
jgi:hypothetical protein